MKQRKKKRLGSYPVMNLVLSITLALLVIGLFGLLVLHTNKLTNMIRENVEIQVFLNRNISESERTRVQKAIFSQPYALKKENKPQITFVSKEEAAKDFIKETGEDFTSFLGENPLHDAFIVKIDPAYHSSERLNVIKTELEKINGIFEVVYVDNLIQSINQNLTRISLFLLGFSILLIIAVILLINNTIKLALFSQRFLIRSMQLVGATKGFIRKPFVVRSFWMGIISGVVAAGILYAFLRYSYKMVEDLVLLEEPDKIYIMLGSLIILGALIGIISTYRAVNKYLKMSLDELY